MESAAKEKREAASGARKLGGGLKDDEDLRLREDALKDEVAELKRKWRDAEGRVTERDAQAIELRWVKSKAGRIGCCGGEPAYVVVAGTRGEGACVLSG